MGQLLTGQARSVRLLAACGLVAASLACRANPSGVNAAATARGGELTASIRTEPRNFARLGARESTTELVALLLHASLIRINRVTDDVEPWLAESWTRSPDGREYTLKLRPGVTFSDGHPMTAGDVLFSFDAFY